MQWGSPTARRNHSQAVNTPCNTHDCISPFDPLWLQIKSHCKLVHSCIVYTQLAPRQQLFHVAPAMQQPNTAVTTSVAVQKRAVERYSHLLKVAQLLEIRRRVQHYSCHCEALGALEMRRSTTVDINKLKTVCCVASCRRRAETRFDTL